MNWNKRLLYPGRMLRLESWSKKGSAAWMMWLALPPPVRLGCVLMPLVLVTMCAGCAATSMPSSEPAKNPSPPPTRLSASPPDYLGDAQRFISESRKTLQELTQKLAN